MGPSLNNCFSHPKVIIRSLCHLVCCSKGSRSDSKSGVGRLAGVKIMNSGSTVSRKKLRGLSKMGQGLMSCLQAQEGLDPSAQNSPMI